MQAVIVSGDKDFYQLIGPGVVLLNPGRGGPAAVEELWVDESNASERLGVPPGQVIDFLALVGDSSDNIPGVKGIGEKGAQKLLAEYGSLDAILANAEKVEPKRAREALLAHADNARLSRELVTIHLDVPVSVAVQDLRPRPADQAALTQLLTELEFFSLVKKLVDDACGGAGARSHARRCRAAGRARALTSQSSRPRASRRRPGDRRPRPPARHRGAAPRGAARGARHRDQLALTARGGADRPVAGGEPDRGVVPPLRAPPAGRGTRRARTGEEPSAARRTRHACRWWRCSPIPRCPRRGIT